MKTRAGAFQTDGAGPMLTLLRAELAPDTFDTLNGLSRTQDGTPFNRGTVGIARANLANYERSLSTGTPNTAALDAALAILEPGGVPTLNRLAFSITGEEDSGILDPTLAENFSNRWVDLAGPIPDLLNAKWGSDQGTDAIFAVLSSFDTPIRPQGYFTGAAGFDSVNEFGNNLASPTNVAGIGQVENSNPFFVGPDGIQNTADDLPIGPDEGAGSAFRFGRDFVTGTGSNVLEGQTLIDLAAGAGVTPDQFCRENLSGEQGGVNLDGNCVRIPDNQRVIDDPTSPLFGQGLPKIADPRIRPESAFLEPPDLTGLRSGSLPARPANPSGGLFYVTAGYDRARKSHHSLVGNLDVDFRQSELEWSHGASQDEHEFREGYVEFEMFDSQLFARVGKLIMVWGKTELFRNQDRLNPTDIGISTLASLEDARVAQWAGDFTWYWGYVGPVEDVRTEFVAVVNRFTPTDLGKCGEPFVFTPVCGLSFGGMAHGLTGIGLIGENRPDDYSWEGMDYAFRIEGRWDRFTFAITDFWGWDDGFTLDVVNEYSRRVDTTTGAPVQSFGSLSCKVRTVDGVAVGPDGVAGTGDELVPSVGNCLLFEPDAASPGTDKPRGSAAVALNHYANQTLFHTICTLTFDQDGGACALDSTNNDRLLQPTADVLGGKVIASLAIQGFESIRNRPTVDPTGEALDSIADPNLLSGFKLPESLQGDFALLDTAVQDRNPSDATNDLQQVLFARVGPFASIGNLDPDPETNANMQALLGCGPRFSTGCDQLQAGALADAGVIPAPVGGVDLMNADASVITQEFSVIQVSPDPSFDDVGPLVGYRNGYFGANPDLAANPQGYFEAGISVPERVIVDGESVAFTPDLATALEQSGINATQYALNNQDPANAEQMIATDFQVEPFKYLLDPFWTSKGVLRYYPSWGDDPDDPSDDDKYLVTDPNGKPIGESCSNVFGSPDGACTALETLSANFQRLFITNEIIGADDVFDPPETVFELGAMLDGNFASNAFGDPLSGPDGIVFNDTDTDGNGIADKKIVSSNSGLASAPRPDQIFIPGQQNCPSAGLCYRTYNEELLASGQIDFSDTRDDAGNLINFLDPLPIRTDVEIVSGGGGTAQIDPHDLSNLNLQTLNAGLTIEYDTNGDSILEEIKFVPDVLTRFTSTVPGVFQDLDGNSVSDLDQDLDGTLDFIDDGAIVCVDSAGAIVDCPGSPEARAAAGLEKTFLASFGPSSDDNFLCGTGIPGDPLGEALQVEFADTEDYEALSAIFPDFPERAVGPNGELAKLPPRSPVFCRGVSGLLGVTSFSLPAKRAGGATGFGRRDFLWQGGQEVMLNHQKKNVFGFSLDFAEDITKTSWGVEFSWTADKIFGDTLTGSGQHNSDEYVLSISMDRPTFINFLNPNRTFFFNVQMFVKYFSDYHGGARRGMFGTSDGPFDTQIIMFFFTGYFQDRLGPRLVSVWNPPTNTGAILTQLSYRFNERFSGILGYNNFFGHVNQVEQRFNPVGPGRTGHPDTTSETLRGIAPARNRDEIFLRIRYTF
jgi:hypothetical protein